MASFYAEAAAAGLLSAVYMLLPVLWVLLSRMGAAL